MHIDAVGAAIDLRGAELHELEQLAIQPAVVDEAMERAECLGAFGRGCAKIHSSFHDRQPFRCAKSCCASARVIRCSSMPKSPLARKSFASCCSCEATTSVAPVAIET